MSRRGYGDLKIVIININVLTLKVYKNEPSIINTSFNITSYFIFYEKPFLRTIALSIQSL